MTKGTDNRNIKKIVQSILQRYNVDNLQMEVDLVVAWTRYMNEREEGLTPAQTRERIATEFGVLGFIGISDVALERGRMTQIIMDTIGVDVNEDSTNWQAVITHCLAKEKEGQSIKTYREWMDRDPYNSPKKHQIAQNPMLIKQTWRSAFETKTDETRSEYKVKPQFDENGRLINA